MSREEYMAAQQAVRVAAAILKEMNLEDALCWAEAAGAVGPILDPTLYREKQQALREDIDLLRAAREFQAKTLKLWEGRPS